MGYLQTTKLIAPPQTRSEPSSSFCCVSSRRSGSSLQPSPLHLDAPRIWIRELFERSLTDIQICTLTARTSIHNLQIDTFSITCGTDLQAAKGIVIRIGGLG